MPSLHFGVGSDNHSSRRLQTDFDLLAQYSFVIGICVYLYAKVFGGKLNILAFSYRAYRAFHLQLVMLLTCSLLLLSQPRSSS